MDDASKRVHDAAADARSNNGVEDDMVPWEEPEPASPLDRETLDEQRTNRMGEQWERTRRECEGCDD